MKIKKLLSVILACVLGFGTMAIPGFADSTDNWIESANTAWYNESSAEFSISTAEELAGLARLVNGGNGFKNKTVKLAADIELAGKEWTPIGTASCAFEGIFDGQEKVISGMKINISADKGYGGYGLFAVASNATITNVKQQNVDVFVSAGNDHYKYTGSLVGHAKTCTITNCSAAGKVYSTVRGVGGLIGCSFNANKLEKLSFGDSNTSASRSTVRGIDGVANDLGYGGIAGYFCYGGGMKDCSVVNADIGNGEALVGGLVGWANTENAMPVFDSCTVTNCNIKGGGYCTGGIVSTFVSGAKVINSSVTDTKITGQNPAALIGVYDDPDYSGNIVADGTNTVTNVTDEENNVIAAVSGCVVSVNGNYYFTLADAIAAANDGDTIVLGKGTFSTYNGVSPKKSLTFTGAGKDKTKWIVGAEVPDPSKEGSEYNGDYSFDGCDTVTFDKMTLQYGTKDYLGFIRINNFSVKDCVVNGKITYGGSKTASYTGTVFNAPGEDYSIFLCEAAESMSFEKCEFNGAGKFINVYKEGDGGDDSVAVNFKDCTVNSSKPNKSVLNIKNKNRNYTINISGTNTVTGLAENADTGSVLYQLEKMKPADGEKTGTKVIIDGTVVWEYLPEVKMFDTIAVLSGKSPWLFAGVDSADYDKVGFCFAIDGGTEYDAEQNVVCEQIKCGEKIITAKELGGKYIFGVKLGEEFKSAFTAAPFAVIGDTRVDGAKTEFAAKKSE